MIPTSTAIYHLTVNLLSHVLHVLYVKMMVMFQKCVRRKDVEIPSKEKDLIIRKHSGREDTEKV